MLLSKCDNAQNGQRQSENKRNNIYLGEAAKSPFVSAIFLKIAISQPHDSRAGIGVFALMAVIGPLDLLHILLHKWGISPP